MGAGSYIADGRDVEYCPERDIRSVMDGGNGATIGGRFNNMSPAIWVLKKNAMALMRQGGAWGEDWNPCFHSWPFAGPLAPEGSKRVLERYSFTLA